MTDSSSLRPEDLERIAAYLDGRLTAAERSQFVERLDREEALYEVFVETVRYQEQSAEPKAEVVDIRSRRRVVRWALPAAAAAVLAAAVVTPILLRYAGDFGSARVGGMLVADDGLESQLGSGWYEQGWSETRGLTPSGVGLDLAFRLGVRAVDLQVALRTNRLDDALVLTHRVERLLSGLESSELVQFLYSDLRRGVEGDVAPKELLKTAAAAEETWIESYPELAYGYEFGKWAEAGKLAAASGNRKLLRSRTFRRVLPDVQARDEWLPPVRQSLSGIERQLARPAAEMDLERLAELFTAIIDES